MDSLNREIVQLSHNNITKINKKSFIIYKKYLYLHVINY